MIVEITVDVNPYEVVISSDKPEIITVQPIEPVSIVIDMKRDGIDGLTPQKGVDYFDGLTPQKGVDYFDGVTPQKGVDYFDGLTPQKGVDYFDGVTPQKGVDYFDGEDGATDIIITGADSGILADFKGTTTNTIVKTFPTPAGLFSSKNSFWIRLSVIKWNGVGTCTVRVYFNTTQSITNGSQILLSTSIIPIGNIFGNISKTMAFLPFSDYAYIMLLPTNSTFVDYLTLTAANITSVLPGASSGFLIVAFQNSHVAERTLLSSFNLSKI